MSATPSQIIRPTTLVTLILVVYIVPVVLILTGIIPFSFKFYVLIAGAVVVWVFLWRKGFSLRELGFSSSQAVRSIRDVIPVTVILAVIIAVIYLLGNVERVPTERWLFFSFYIFISSPVQEFLFRASLNRMFDSVRITETVQMVLSALLYSFIHVIYQDALTLVITFVIGLIWFRLYLRTRHLLGVSISHAVLGALTIVAGIVD